MNTEIAHQYTVLIVEDEINTLHRLAGIVGSDPRLQVVGTSTSFADGYRLLTRYKPDILLTDLGLPDGSGVELIHQVSAQQLPTLAMVITIFGDENHVIEAMKAGASGYILKDGSAEDIVDLVIKMTEGGAPMSPSIARYLLKYFRNLTEPRQVEASQAPQLTETEKNILQLVSKGYTAKEIANINNSSYYTVTTHLKNTYKKLSINNRAEAVMEAIKLGLVHQHSD